VADCDCPSIDVWLDYNLDPYSPVEEYQIPRLQAMLSQNPACDPSEETDDSVAAFDPSEEHF
jgi:hypothetical protein